METAKGASVDGPDNKNRMHELWHVLLVLVQALSFLSFLLNRYSGRGG